MNLGYFYYKILMDKIIALPEYQRYLQSFDKKKAPDIQKKQGIIKPLFENSFFMEEEFEYAGYEKKEFNLKVKGKGLLIGVGYTHEIPAVKGQFINGFYFDYTTGMPLIPGSSIKGAIRSTFPYKKDELKSILKKIKKSYEDKKDELKSILKKSYEDKKFTYEEINKGKMQYIKKLTSLNENEIFVLRDEIFNYGDIFLDAYIISKGKFFDEDYFAPQTDEFSHPVPLKFLRIKEGIEFKFRFLLKPNFKILNINERAEFFKKIIQSNGLGAKTNENYGRFG